MFIIKFSYKHLQLAFLLFRNIFTECDKKLVTWSKKYFSHQNEQLTAKLSFSAALKHFTDMTKTCHLGQKSNFLSNCATYSYTMLFCCFEAFLLKLIFKKCHSGHKSVFLIKMSYIWLNKGFLQF